MEANRARNERSKGLGISSDLFAWLRGLSNCPGPGAGLSGWLGWFFDDNKPEAASSRLHREGTEMPVGDLSRENARHECGTLWCVRGTVVRTLGSVGSTLHSHRSCFTFARACVCLHCMCTCACSRTAFVRRQHTHVPRRRVRVFAGKERTTEGQGAIGRSKGDGEIRRRQVNGGRKREIMPRREDGWIIRATDGRKLEGQRGTARR